mmetsp:Transcript_5920/g.8975  ORF Transcript_5920/g.8975 Transcript_5920/m.8975 type:complete len:493 (+) Transcript_5920:33-1511(+)
MTATDMDIDAPMSVDMAEAPEVTASASRVPSIADVSKTISYINRGVELSQPRLLQRAIRQNAHLRRGATKSLLNATLSRFVPPSCPSYAQMQSSVALIPSAPDDSNTDTEIVDTPDTIIPEVEVFLFTLVLTTMLRHGLNEAAAQSAAVLIGRIKTFSRRTLDLFASKAFFYFSLAFERIDQLESIRATLLGLYRTCCLHHDEMGQAVLLNLILRNYLHYDLVVQAQTLASKTSFPESASNNQFCRYLYAMGRIQAVQLEYSDAYLRLTMAARKAPQDTARGFALTVHKLSVIVQLLMGDIPERGGFNVPEFRVALLPYLALTQAVRAGDLHEFAQVMQTHGTVFKADKNYSLIRRLGHNVLKTGLRKISVSYSRISLADIAEKLQLSSAKAAEFICARAIKDGVIEATLDHEAGVLVSNEIVDVYATEEPQKAFHRRIVFCLDVHNEAVKSMRYPPDAYKKEIASKGKSKGEDEKTIEELIKEMEDDMDEL